MKTILTTLLLAISTQLLADFENATIYKTNGDTINCVIDVYEPGVLIGNVARLSYQTGEIKSSISLDHVSSVEMEGNTYQTLTLEEEGEEYFDEEVMIKHKVIAKLLHEGEITLYQYYYLGNNIYADGKPNKTFGKSLHERPIISSKKESYVVYRMTYSFRIKHFFPINGKKILSDGIKYDQIDAAVAEGNKYLASR